MGNASASSPPWNTESKPFVPLARGRTAHGPCPSVSGARTHWWRTPSRSRPNRLSSTQPGEAGPGTPRSTVPPRQQEPRQGEQVQGQGGLGGPPSPPGAAVSSGSAGTPPARPIEAHTGLPIHRERPEGAPATAFRRPPRTAPPSIPARTQRAPGTCLPFDGRVAATSELAPPQRITSMRGFPDSPLDAGLLSVDSLLRVVHGGLDGSHGPLEGLADLRDGATSTPSAPQVRRHARLRPHRR